METIELFGIQIHNVSMDEAVRRVFQLVVEGRNAMVVTPNVDHIVKLQSDEEFRALYQGADLVVADGMPLVWTSRLAGKPLKERVTGADLFVAVCAEAALNGKSVFLLGSATQETIDTTAAVLTSRFPGLRVVGSVSPSFTFDKDEAESASLVETIRAAHPDILFVGVGAPKQEKWVARHRVRLGVPVSLGVGASFDFVAGTVNRAPVWMQKSGLEWFYRFIKEPRRMFQRYFIDDSVFFSLAVREWWNARPRSGRPR